MPEENPRKKRSDTLILGVIIVAALIGGAFYAWKTHGSKPAAVASVPETPVADTAISYTSAKFKFSLKYPNDFSMDESYSNISVNQKKPISGVKFTIPLSMATGTNLSSDTGLSIEQLPHAKNCTGDIYLAANVKPHKVVDNAVTYSVATSSGAAAGNLYEEMVYAVASSSPCIAVRYFIHSSAIGNYSGVVREFDRTALLTVFDKIRKSLVR